MYHHLLIPTDGSSLSAEAIRHGVDLAQETGATVSFLTVIDPFHAITFEAEQLEDTRDTYYAHARGLAERYLSEAEKLAEAARVKSSTICVEDSHPYRVIIQGGTSRTSVKGLFSLARRCDVQQVSKKKPRSFRAERG